MSPDPRCVLGLGTCQGADPDEIRVLVSRTLAAADIPTARLCAVATVDAREDEAGILAVAAWLDVPLFSYPAALLATVRVPHPSDMARAALGTASVAEAAALLGARDTAGYASQDTQLLVPKRKSAPPGGQPSRVTCAVAGSTQRPARQSAATREGPRRQ